MNSISTPSVCQFGRSVSIAELQQAWGCFPHSCVTCWEQLPPTLPCKDDWLPRWVNVTLSKLRLNMDSPSDSKIKAAWDGSCCGGVSQSVISHTGNWRRSGCRLSHSTSTVQLNSCKKVLISVLVLVGHSKRIHVKQLKNTYQICPTLLVFVYLTWFC